MSARNEAWAELEQHVADILEKPYSDFARISDGLFVGSHPEGKIDPFDLGADVVVTLTGEPSTSGVPRGKLLIHWPIKDGPIPRLSVLRPLARLIASCIEDGASVFVHCAAGMNRSCLVAGLVLIEQGMSGSDAVERVRDRRKGSLSDEYAAWLTFVS
jgi:dual specificity protein phosphatase-like protein